MNEAVEPEKHIPDFSTVGMRPRIRQGDGQGWIVNCQEEGNPHRTPEVVEISRKNGLALKAAYPDGGSGKRRHGDGQGGWG